MTADEPVPSPIDWDEAAEWLDELAASPHVELIGSAGEVTVMETGWSRLEYHDAGETSVALGFAGGLALYIPREVCETVSAARWENGLSLMLAFELGTFRLRLQASRWQHVDD